MDAALNYGIEVV